MIERFKLSLGEDTEGYITDKNEHKTYFLRGDTAKKKITIILNQLYNENEDLKTDISVLYRHYDEYERICSKLKRENELLKTQLQNTSAQRDEFHRATRENANRVEKLEKENEQLKQFKEDVFNKINMHLRMLPTARDKEFDEEYGDPSLYSGAIYILETLKKELIE